ncbi:hypothetical protein [Methanobrevibacter arboriphilus]|uniref:Uncharacterized protein n=1 Tax=Methanobrevibacter arboriphilus TaxID=39441 RepID=A0ACA8R1Y7_METAZ|nr:hypothetical protein [Methanobrevibacter arboriphilus]BBL61539.1 hypothetical protein MarbSA_05790 [Methanobrevibacter arboriphilus]
MSFKNAFKAIFISYYNNKPIRAKYLRKIAHRENVNFNKLLKAVMEKGLDLTL